MRMSTWLTPALSLLLVQCASSGPTDSLDQVVTEVLTGPISLQALEPGDRLEVNLESSGCFHHYKTSLVIEPDAVVGVQLVGMAQPVGGLQLPVFPIASRTLNQAELAGMDLTLAAFREGSREGQCTTQSDMKLSLFRNGHLVREEAYHEGTCSELPSGAVHFSALVDDALSAVVVTAIPLPVPD